MLYLATHQPASTRQQGNFNRANTHTHTHTNPSTALRGNVNWITCRARRTYKTRREGDVKFLIIQRGILNLLVNSRPQGGKKKPSLISISNESRRTRRFLYALGAYFLLITASSSWLAALHARNWIRNTIRSSRVCTGVWYENCSLQVIAVAKSCLSDGKF